MFLHSVGHRVTTNRITPATVNERAQSDGALNKTVRMKIRHYRQIYSDSPDPIVFLSITVSTSGRVYEDFTRLCFSHGHREDSILAGGLPEESEQFRFL